MYATTSGRWKPQRVERIGEKVLAVWRQKKGRLPTSAGSDQEDGKAADGSVAKGTGPTLFLLSKYGEDASARAAIAEEVVAPFRDAVATVDVEGDAAAVGDAVAVGDDAGGQAVQSPHEALADLIWWLYLARGPHCGLSFLPKEKNITPTKRRPRGVRRIMSNGKRIEDMLVRELQAELKKRGSTISGRKAALAQRLADLMDAEDLRREQEELALREMTESIRMREEMHGIKTEPVESTVKAEPTEQAMLPSDEPSADAMEIEENGSQSASGWRESSGSTTTSSEDAEKLELFLHLAPAVLLLSQTDMQACDRVFIRPPDLQLAPIYELFGGRKGKGNEHDEDEEDDDYDDDEAERRGLTTRRLLLRMRKAWNREEWKDVAKLLMYCLVHSARIRISFHSVGTCCVEMEPVINELLQHPDSDFILQGLLFLKELMADDPYALFSHSTKMLDPMDIGPGMEKLLAHSDWRVRQASLSCFPTKSLTSTRLSDSFRAGMGNPAISDIIIQMAMSDDMPLVRLQALEQLVGYYLHQHLINSTTIQKLMELSMHCMKSVDPDIALSGIRLLGIVCIHNMEPRGDEQAKQDWDTQCRRAMRSLIDLLQARYRQVPPLMRLALRAIANQLNDLHILALSPVALEKISVLPEELRLVTIKEVEAERLHRAPKERNISDLVAFMDGIEPLEPRQDNKMVLDKCTRCISYLLELGQDPYINEVTDTIKSMVKADNDWTVRDSGLLIIKCFPFNELRNLKMKWVVELAISHMNDAEPEIRITSCAVITSIFECLLLIDRHQITAKAMELLRDPVHRVRIAATKLILKAVCRGDSIWRESSEAAEKIIKDCMDVISEVTDAIKNTNVVQERLQNEDLVCGLLNVLSGIVGGRPYDAETRMASLLPIMLEKLLPMLTSSSSMIRKEIIDLVLELSHYRDLYRGFEVSMRFQFHEHEILQTTEKILRENMEAVRELQSSQKPTPTATASKEDKKGKDKERLEEEEEEDLQLEEHKDALWDSLVLIQGLMKTDPEAVLGTLKAEEVIETVTTLLKSSREDAYHRELAYDILDALLEHHPPEAPEEISVIFTELTNSITQPATELHEWMAACNLIQRLAPLKFLEPDWVRHISASLALYARRYCRTESLDQLHDAIRPILVLAYYHEAHVHPRVLSILALGSSSSSLGSVDFRMVEGFANLMLRFFPPAPPSTSTSSSSSSSSSSLGSSLRASTSASRSVQRFVAALGGPSVPGTKAKEEKPIPDLGPGDPEAMMPLLDYAAPSLIISFATLLSHAQRQEDDRTLKTSRQRRAAFSRAVSSHAGTQKRGIGSRLNQISLLEIASDNTAGGEERRRKKEEERMRKAREEKVRDALNAVSAAMWPRALGRELLRLPYEQRDELGYALARYIPTNHDLAKALNNPHGLLWE